MKFKFPVKFTPIILAGLLSTNLSCKKKEKTSEVIENYLKSNDKTIVETIDDVNNSEILENEVSFDDEIDLKEENEIIDYSEITNNIPFINGNDFSEYLNETNVITANSVVNIRSSATTKSEKLNKLSVGESLPLLNIYDEWYEVNYYGRSAYVYKKYAKVTKGYYSKYEMSDMVYTLEKTFLYDINNNEIIKNIPKNEVAEVYAQNEKYYLVKCGGTFGYILKDCVCSLGDDYVIIDISSQNLKVYINDKLIVDTLIVTGKDSTPTYCGLYNVYKKEENVTWDEFDVTVRYWMPFNRGEGMHDAKWRSEFGGEIYHKKGSHGCVNIPTDIMPIIYENINVGTPVLVKK